MFLACALWCVHSRPALADLAPGPVHALILAYRAEVRACYVEQLRGDPTLGGRLVMRFEIDVRGVVVRASVVETERPGLMAVGSCVATRALRWRFPAGPSPFQITYPFVLYPG